jgi:hypothetical protein
MTELERKVGAFIRDHDGCTSIDVAEALDPPTTNKRVYGAQRPTSTAIATLRRRGYVKDVQKRCPDCKRALTRHQRNVGLHLTRAGSDAFGVPLFDERLP